MLVFTYQRPWYCRRM